MEVLKLVEQIDCYKSSAISHLSSRVIKDAILAIPGVITALFNLSLSTGVYPDMWKIAKVIPIHKGGNTSEVNNYRLVSLLPLPGKLLERIMHTRISNYLEMNDLLNENQGAFRKGHSTINTVSDFTDDIFLAMNNSKCTLTMFVDFHKAFDTVNHAILLKKCELLGITNGNLEWLTSYLSLRKQCTLANGNMSSNLNISCGVPQGSILGPLLFLIFINDIGRDFQYSLIRLFADDTAIYLSDPDPQVASRKLQKDVDRLMNWCQTNQLTININKTKCMLFGSRKYLKKCRPPEIMMGYKPVHFTDNYKYLGVTLDKGLNFQLHVKNVYNLAAHKIYLLGIIRPYLTIESALFVYKTKVLPYIDYGDILYHKTHKQAINKIQRLQNRESSQNTK